MQLCSAVTAFSMIGLCEIRQLEINGESFGNSVGFLRFKLPNNILRLTHFIVENVRNGSGVNT